MSVIIKVDTGFVGGIHEEETGLTVQQWKALSDESKDAYFQDAINNYIDVFAVDEDNEDENIN